jgi:hypothetical protein
MATRLPQFAQRALRRKTGGIDRLSTQFRKDIESLTGREASALAQYQAGVTEKLKPFEAAKATYETVSFPAYEAQAAAYKAKLDQYLADVASYQSNPVEFERKLINTQMAGRYGPVYTFEGGIRGSQEFLENQGYEVAVQQAPRMAPTGTLKKFKSAPTKPELGEMPKAPEAPTAPTIAAFDTSAFETERKGLESGLQRELGERRAARLAAVSRRGSRPMLQGA